jgi:hypothetical protein
MFGLFLGITLFLWGVIPFHSMLIWILPILGVILGLAMARWAPFGGEKVESTTAEPAATEAGE